MKDQQPNRREMLRTAARYGIASLVVLGGVALVHSGGSDECDRKYPCEKCAEFGGCGLEKASSARAKT